jgi:hypothetical protein
MQAIGGVSKKMEKTAEQQPAVASVLPSDATLKYAAKLSIEQDKPIMMDYWKISLDGTAIIGVRETNEKLLIRSEEEYTSTISKVFKSNKEYVVVTENSIYLVSGNIESRRIS